jgi:hypothetical protein
MDNRIANNFNLVYNELVKTNKRTAIAKAMGFSTTTQLENVQTGVACISTPAIMNLVKNFDVNPTFLFTGSGNMFLIKNKPENRYKVWVEIERIETDEEGNETYHDEECPIGIAYRETIQDAVTLQNLINQVFGEIF